MCKESRLNATFNADNKKNEKTWRHSMAMETFNEFKLSVTHQV